MRLESLGSQPSEQQSQIWSAESHPLAEMLKPQTFHGTEKTGQQTKPPETTVNTTVKTTNNNDNTNKNNNDNSNKNNNDNSNKNNNTNKSDNRNDNTNTSRSDSSSDSSSTSSSTSDSHSSSSATGGSVGPIDNRSGASAKGGNAKGGDASSISGGGTSAINQNIRTYVPAAIIPANLPTGGECTVGSTWGGNALVAGFTKGNSKVDKNCMAQNDQHFQQNLDFQKQSLDANVQLQREAMQLNLNNQAKQVEADQATALKAQEAQVKSLQLDQVKAVCDASIQQAQAADKSYHNVDQFSKGASNPSLVESTGAMAVLQAGNALKLASMCADAFGNQLGVDKSSVPALPSIKVTDSKPNKK